MKNSKICICIPLYNAENTINETVKSILNQSYKNFELIISDNHSTDKSISVIKKLNDERIKIVKTKSFYEIGEDNFNRCIKLSNAEFTAILHSDDIYHKDFLYHQLKNLNDNPKIAISFTEGQNVNSYGKFIKKIVSPFKSDNNNLYFENIYPLLLENYNFFITPTMVFRTDVFLKNSYKWNYKDFKSSSDLALWLEVSRKYQISIVKKNMISVRLSSNQGSSAVRNKIFKSDFFLVVEHFNNLFTTNKSNKYFVKQNMKLLNARENLRILSNLIYYKEYGEIKNYFSKSFCLDILFKLHKKKYLFHIFLLFTLITFNLIKLNKFNYFIIKILKRNYLI